MRKMHFHCGWDPSWVRTSLERVSRHRDHPSLIGEGTHFKVWQLLAPNHQNPLVIKLAKTTFLRGLKTEQERWVRHMNQLKGENVPMFPPCEIFWFEDRIAIGMPFFPNVIMPSQHRLYSREIKALLEALNDRGMHLDDHLQIGIMNDEAYVLDWSDLKKREGSLTRKRGKSGDDLGR